MCSGVSGTIWGAGGNGGGIDELILLLLLMVPRGAGELLLEELRFLGFGDSCGTLLRLRFVVVVFVLIVVLALLAVVWAGALIMVGSGARGR